MKLRSFRRFFVEAFQSMFRNLAMTIASIATIALTLFVCGVFSVIVLNVDKFAGDIESTVEIQAFVEETADEQSASELMGIIRDIEGVNTVTFVSKEEALADMAVQLEETPEGLLSSLGQNPLPDSYMVTVDDAELVAPVAAELEGLAGIESARYGGETIDNLFTMLKWVRYFGLALIVFLVIASIVIVAFNIKITVASRKSEIFIMRNVGASNWYIRWPFCIAGMIMGLFGGMIAVALLYGAYSLLVEQLGSVLVFMNLVSVNMAFVYIFLAMVIFGIFLGSAGSMVSLNVYLKERKAK
ncbi:MAG: permease-like cell division protein FtsX [Firmicutes bacterium]|nr:permease-like cell division protein FtsX [Bacillota bacterium]